MEKIKKAINRHTLNFGDPPTKNAPIIVNNGNTKAHNFQLLGINQASQPTQEYKSPKPRNLSTGPETFAAPENNNEFISNPDLQISENENKIKNLIEGAAENAPTNILKQKPVAKGGFKKSKLNQGYVDSLNSPKLNEAVSKKHNITMTNSTLEDLFKNDVNEISPGQQVNSLSSENIKQPKPTDTFLANSNFKNYQIKEPIPPISIQSKSDNSIQLPSFPKTISDSRLRQHSPGYRKSKSTIYYDGEIPLSGGESQSIVLSRDFISQRDRKSSTLLPKFLQNRDPTYNSIDHEISDKSRAKSDSVVNFLSFKDQSHTNKKQNKPRNLSQLEITNKATTTVESPDRFGLSGSEKSFNFNKSQAGLNTKLAHSKTLPIIKEEETTVLYSNHIRRHRNTMTHSSTFESQSFIKSENSSAQWSKQDNEHFPPNTQGSISSLSKNINISFNNDMLLYSDHKGTSTSKAKVQESSSLKSPAQNRSEASIFYSYPSEHFISSTNATVNNTSNILPSSKVEGKLLNAKKDAPVWISYTNSIKKSLLDLKASSRNSLLKPFQKNHARFHSADHVTKNSYESLFIANKSIDSINSSTEIESTTVPKSSDQSKPAEKKAGSHFHSKASGTAKIRKHHTEDFYQVFDAPKKPQKGENVNIENKMIEDPTLYQSNNNESLISIQGFLSNYNEHTASSSNKSATIADQETGPISHKNLNSTLAVTNLYFPQDNTDTADLKPQDPQFLATNENWQSTQSSHSSNDPLYFQKAVDDRNDSNIEFTGRPPSFDLHFKKQAEDTTKPTILAHQDNFTLSCFRPSEDIVEYTVESKNPLITRKDIFSLVVAVIVIQFMFYDFWAIPIIPVVVYFVFMAFKVKKEKLVAIKNFGVQIESHLYIGIKSVKLIEIQKIKDIVIHESLSFFQYKFFLSILVKDSENTDVVFSNILPGLPILKPVYLGTKDMML